MHLSKSSSLSETSFKLSPVTLQLLGEQKGASLLTWGWWAALSTQMAPVWSVMVLSILILQKPVLHGLQLCQSGERSCPASILEFHAVEITVVLST